MVSVHAASFLIFTFSYLDITRARDRGDVWSLCKEPSERNLYLAGIVLRSYLLDFLYDLEHIREVPLRVPGCCPEIALFEVIRAPLCNCVGHKKRNHCLDGRTSLPVSSPLPSGEYTNTVV